MIDPTYLLASIVGALLFTLVTVLLLVWIRRVHNEFRPIRADQNVRIARNMRASEKAMERLKREFPEPQ